MEHVVGPQPHGLVSQLQAQHEAPCEAAESVTANDDREAPSKVAQRADAPKTESAPEPVRASREVLAAPLIVSPFAAQTSSAPPPAPAAAAAGSSKSPMVTQGIGTALQDLKGAAMKAPTLLELAGQRAAPSSRQSASAIGAPKKQEEREAARDDRPALASPLLPPTQTATNAASRPTEPTAIAPPPPVPFVAPAHLDDPSLRVVVLPTIARMNVETSEGSLSLQVRVHDGVTDVRASGAGAMLVDARQGELRMALAHEGLKLGQFDLAQSDSGSSSRHQRPETPDERGSTARPRPTPRPQLTTTLRADGRLSVKA